MNIDNFCNLGAALQNKQIEVGKQPQIYFYRSNEDSIYEMLSEGYFNALNLRVAKDDLILLYSPKDEQKVFAKVISNNGGIVKIIEMSEDDFQHTEMPTPSVEYLNKIIQYIGETTTEAPIYINGFFYKCVENSGVYSWENIIVQDSYLKSETYNKTEVDTELAKKLNTDGSNTFTGVLKMRSTVSFKGAVAPSWSGIGIYELKDDDSVSLMASMEKTDGFTPASNNTYNIGVNSRKWKDLYLAGKAYVSTINNGGDIAVPASSGTMALTSDLTNFADKDLSNLTSQGKNIANWSSNVSNCITNIPQDVKLELNNGTLTLKAGSKVYVPNGAGVFDIVTIESDISRSNFGSSNGQIFLYYVGNNQSLGQGTVSSAGSGTSTPSSGYYYNTSDNKIYDSAVDKSISFPIAICKASSGTLVSLDQIFNGFGYIGSTVYALPGVKGLIPDGRNEDGTLKSIKARTNSVLTYTNTNNVNKYFSFTNPSDGIWTSINYKDRFSSLWRFDSKENQWYFNNNKYYWIDFAVCTCGSVSPYKIELFTPKTAFQTLDYNDTEYIASQSFPGDRYVDLTLGASGATYTAQADGYIVMTWDCGSDTSFITMIQSPIADQIVYGSNYASVSKTFKVKKGNFQIN